MTTNVEGQLLILLLLLLLSMLFETALLMVLDEAGKIY
jgi:hypothetical protein